MGDSPIGRLSPPIRWLFVVVAILLLGGAVHFFAGSNPALLALFFLPTLAAGYWFGRRGGLLTAGAAIVVALLALFDAALLAPAAGTDGAHRWINLGLWGGSLLLVGHASGRLFEGQRGAVRELRDTYWGFLSILNLFVNKDEYSQNHAQRVSSYAASIAQAMGLPPARVDDVRAAALVRDLAKLKLSRDALTQAAQAPREPGQAGSSPADYIGGTLRRIAPIVLAEPAEGQSAGESGASGAELPLEARILAVADVYASLTADRPYRKAMSANDARDVIVRGAGREFDQDVVAAFERAFEARQLEIQEGSA